MSATRSQARAARRCLARCSTRPAKSLPIDVALFGIERFDLNRDRVARRSSAPGSTRRAGRRRRPRSDRGTLPVAVARPARPYPGLRPFEKDEWAIFFGRERMIDEVIGRLAESRLVLIHGVSGSGKSSLVRAGVLPKLALQYSRHDAPWLTCAMRPSGGPLWNLAAEFARLEGSGEDLERIGAIAGRFNARSATLASVAASLEGVVGKSVCMLVDQFEELFRYEKEMSRDEAELFVDLIARAATGERGQGGAEQRRPACHHHHAFGVPGRMRPLRRFRRDDQPRAISRAAHRRRRADARRAPAGADVRRRV